MTVSLGNVEALAQWLGLSAWELEWLCDGRRVGVASHHYRYRQIAKRDGGQRILATPKSRLLQAQRKIFRELIRPLAQPHPAAFGFVAGKSAVAHARGHVGARWLLKMDLKAFFDSIASARVRAQFLRLGFAPAVAQSLAQLCTHRMPTSILATLDPATRAAQRSRALPQGAPSSPMLANLVAHSLDQRLAGLAAKFSLRYSRYADDLAFSPQAGAPAINPAYVAKLVEAIIRAEGFVPNAAKRAIIGANARLTITSVVINERTNLSREDFDLLKAKVHRFRTASIQDADLYQQLRGQLSWLQQLNPRKAQKLLDKLTHSTITTALSPTAADTPN